jgi:vacuolar-type H+-ATPase subunit H
MPSRDILEKLFDVERRAETLVSEASAEASRRVSAAKEEADIAFRSEYETAAKLAEQGRAAAYEAADAEHDAAIGSFKARLEGARLDRAAFFEACERYISGIA